MIAGLSFCVRGMKVFVFPVMIYIAPARHRCKISRKFRLHARRVLWTG